MKQKYKENQPAPSSNEKESDTPFMGIPDIYVDYEFPSLLRRIKALVIDLVVLLIIFSISALLINFIGGAPGWVRASIFIFMFYIYDPVFIAFNGATIGHAIMNMKVKRFKNPHKNMSLIMAVSRFFFKSILGWLSFLTVTFDKRKRAIHDKLTGSIVYIKY